MLSKPYIFFGILEFHLSLEFTLTFNPKIMVFSFCNRTYYPRKDGAKYVKYKF